MVLDEICGDYENVDQVMVPELARDGARLGLSIDRAEIVDVLTSLVADGFASAYILGGPSPGVKKLDHMPPLDVPEEYFRTYFCITDKGRQYHESGESWWPFDD